MNRSSIVLALLVAGGVTTVTAQTKNPDAAFTASGRACSDITWEPAVLAKYPDIASACRSVESLNGRDYVRFDGEVTNVSANGRNLTVKFEGNTKPVTLRASSDDRIYIGSRSFRADEIVRGQKLTFRVPASQFVAHFYEPDSQTNYVAREIIEAPAEEPAYQAANLPETGSPLPLIGMLGGMFAGLGALLTLVRRRLHP